MKKAGICFLLVCFLTGCSGASKEIERGMALRAQLLKAASCSFDTEITADYGDRIYQFSLSCQGDSQGNVTFAVTAPESIAGITGRIDHGAGQLCFDDAALQFDLMADGQVTPVSAPWILLKTLRGGCLTAAGQEEDLLRLTMDDSYAEDALRMEIWLNGNDLPVRGEIYYGGRRILSLDVKNFVLS